MSRLITLAFTCVLLIGCASQAPAPEPDAASQAEAEAPAVETPERPFPADSLYPLLVAEFALRRQAYDVALEQYMEQAPRLRDAGVSAHTTHLTQFLQRENEALQAARLWVELDPHNAEANNVMAAVLAHKGRTADALPYLVEVERENGSANFPMVLNGFRQLSDEQRAELMRAIDSLSTEFPKNTQLLLTQALIHAEYQQYEQALNDLDKLFDVEPEQPQAVLLEARILLEQKAKDPFSRLQKVLAKNPDATMLRLQYARLLAASDMHAAREQFEILSEQSPEDSDLLFSLALINREVGDPEAARAYLRKVIATGQRADEAYFYLGRMAEEDHDGEEAIANYMKVEDGQEYLAANSRIGQILVEAGQRDRSHAWFNEQRKNAPQLSDQLYALEADILTRADQANIAMQVLNQGLAETPDSSSLLYGRAMLSEQLNDLAAMERDLRAVIAANPSNATALNALGYTLADRTTRYKEARELVSRALKLQPDEPAILDSMGWVMFRMEQYDEAAVYLRRAYAEFPDPEVAAHLGEVLWAKGETDAAIAVWQGALLRDPGHPVLLGTLGRLGIDMPRTVSPQELPAPSPP